eukprot:gene1442-32816_t
MRLAAVHGIILRAGCFCNPGACFKYLGLSGDDMRANYEAGHVCWDDHDLISGRPTGALRASLGAVSTFEEVYLLLQFINHYFVGRAQGQDFGGRAQGLDSGAVSDALKGPTSARLEATQLSERVTKQATEERKAEPEASSGLEAGSESVTKQATDGRRAEPEASSEGVRHAGDHDTEAGSKSVTKQATEGRKAEPEARSEDGQQASDRDLKAGSEAVSKQAFEGCKAEPEASSEGGQQAGDPVLKVGSESVTKQLTEGRKAEPEASSEGGQQAGDRDLKVGSESVTKQATEGGSAEPEASSEGGQHIEWTPDSRTQTSDLGPQTADRVLTAGRVQDGDGGALAVARQAGQVTAGCSSVSSLHASDLASSQPVDSMSSSYGRLTHIFLYPIKSCAAIQVTSWPLGDNGLLLDREWALIDDSGVRIQQLSGYPAHDRVSLVTPRDVENSAFTDEERSAGTAAEGSVGTPAERSASTAAEGSAGTAESMGKCVQGASNVSPSLSSRFRNLLFGNRSPAERSSLGKTLRSEEEVCQLQSESSSEKPIISEEKVHQLQSESSSGLRSAGDSKKANIVVCGDEVCSTILGEESLLVAPTLHGKRAGSNKCESNLGAGPAAAEQFMRLWFIEALGIPCKLVQQVAGSRSVRRGGNMQSSPGSVTAAEGSAGPAAELNGKRSEKSKSAGSRAPVGLRDSKQERKAKPPAVGFANDGQFLLISALSLEDLNQRLSSRSQDGTAASSTVDEKRFRPNFVVDGFEAYEEDSWTDVKSKRLELELPRLELAQAPSSSLGKL